MPEHNQQLAELARWHAEQAHTWRVHSQTGQFVRPPVNGRGGEPSVIPPALRRLAEWHDAQAAALREATGQSDAGDARDAQRWRELVKLYQEHGQVTLTRVPRADEHGHHCEVHDAEGTPLLLAKHPADCLDIRVGKAPAGQAEPAQAAAPKKTAQEATKTTGPNSPGPVPVLPVLLPGCTQEQATACATVMQWLGTDVGFQFLRQTLAQAGYSIVDHHC